MAKFTHALIAGLALCSNALRKDLKLDSDADFATVEHLASLIQQHAGSKLPDSIQDAVQMLQSSVEASTADVPADLKVALNNVIASIDGDVKTHIKNDQQSTTTALTEDLNQLKATTTEALKQKKSADDIDKIYIQCVEQERAMLKFADDADEKLRLGLEDTAKACKIRDEWPEFTFTPGDVKVSVNCKFSDKSCDADFPAFSSDIDDIIEVATAEVAEEQANFAAADTTCKTLDDADDKLKEEADKLRDDFKKKRTDCQVKLDNSRTQMCVFGKELQKKCSAAGEMKKLIDDVDSKGVTHSHSDRTDAWSAASRAKCMVKKVIGGDAVDDNLVSGCVDAGDYTTDIGAFTAMKTERESYLTTDKFSCTEETITFSGFAWKTSVAEPPLYQEYKKYSFLPPVKTAEGNKPFTFCSA